jgi:pimeloyl-ACP methyl ester carboxylesterase
MKARSHGSAAVLTTLVLAAVALVNRQLAKNAERDNPPGGMFIEIDGVRLHYLERGPGDVLVLLHGYGSMIQDFETSGLLQLASQSYQSSPSTALDLATPTGQAVLFGRPKPKPNSFTKHSGSWASLRQSCSDTPGEHQSQYPTARLDVLVMSPPALPIIGSVLSHTISLIVSRLIWPLLTRKIFAPAPVPPKFRHFPKEMAVRPSQIRAAAAEAALMIPDAIVFREQYTDLKVPTVIIAGEGDRVINFEKQSARLHQELSNSTLYRVSGGGHMVHQTASIDVMSAINEVMKRAGHSSSEVGCRLQAL